MWFTPDDLNLVPNKNDEYNCSYFTKAANFTHLMKLVLLTNESPTAFKMLEQMLKAIDTEDLNAKNSKGWTALMLASGNSGTKSTIDTVKLLVNAGANLDIQNEYGWTALMLAAANSNTTSNIKTVNLLTNAGANLNIQSKCGWTVLMLAAIFSNTDSNIKTVKLLISVGANPMQKNCSCETVCEIVVKKGIRYLQVLKLLCDAELRFALKS